VSSNYLEIEQTIISSFINGSFNYETELSGLPPATNFNISGLHLMVSHVNADTNPVTLGTSGMDESVGYMQVDFKYPQQKGHIVPLTAADIVASAYPVGRQIAGATVVVTVSKTTLSPRMSIGGLIQYSLTIYYKTRNNRN
jgi:hypothetical protein